MARFAPAEDRPRIVGVAYYLAGQYNAAAKAFEEAADWNDLAAAHIGAGHWIDAFLAADRALSLDPDLREAQFNYALAVDGLGVRPVAAKQQRVVLDPEWRRKLPAIAPNETEAWRALKLDSMSDAELASAAVRFPEMARRNAEFFLSTGAEARQLHRARVIAEALQKKSGESLLLEAVREIERNSSTLSAAHRAYAKGRESYAVGRFADAEQELADAQRWFAAGGSPMAALAESYVASAALKQNRATEACAVFDRIVHSQRGTTHYALVGRVLHEIALCEGVRGHWSSSVAAAEESLRIFERLGENANRAVPEAILAQDDDFLGLPQLGWAKGFAAVRHACALGDHFRAHVALAALGRIAVQRRQWDRAAALLRLETKLVTNNPQFEPDLYLRTAVLQWRTGERGQAMEALQRARRAAARLPKELQRIPLADIDGVEGAMMRRDAPALATERLSEAITFQQRAERPITLPELHLARARAFLQMHRRDDAEKDLDAGIRELERQRGKVDQMELRPGIFDDAAELFDEAIALQIDKGDTKAALAYVERGRARAMREQMEIAPTAGTPRLEDGTVLVEYVALPDRLAIFVISASGVTLRTMPVSRATLEQTARAAPRAHLATLYQQLIAPIRDQLQGVSVLNIAPDDVLQRVPFAALFDGSRYLIEQYVVNETPSASVFAAVRQRATGVQQNVLVYANPTIPRNEYPNLPSLDASEFEAAQVFRKYQHGELLVRNAATVQRFLQTAPQYDVIHFAGHAVVNEAEPGASALVCAKGSLTMRQIAAMRFRKTRAVVLAACSTMTGRNAAVEGVPSLARAFVVAGVPAVIGTLWDIEDREAAPVMRVLHEQMARGVEPAIALREAQLASIRSSDPEVRDPRRWAAFSCTGLSR